MTNEQGKHNRVNRGDFGISKISAVSLNLAMRKHLFILGLLHTSLRASVSISVGIKNLDEIVNIKDLKKVVKHIKIY